MRVKSVLPIISTLVPGLFLVAALAQPQFSPPKPCQDQISVSEEGSTTKICPEYAKENARAGEQDVPLKIVITGPADLQLNGVSLAEQADETLGAPPVPVVFSESGEPITTPGVTSVREYNYKMNISKNARPRRYQVRLTLQYPKGPPFSRTFSLKIGAGGGIKISDDSPKVITCFTGSEAPFRLKVSNAFEHYPINIREIRIRTSPANLIEPRQQSVQYTTPIKLSEDRPFDLSIKVAGISKEQVFLGFGANAKVLLDFVYDDGEGRELTDLKEIGLEVKPSVVVSLMAILAGVVSGILLKMYLQYLEKKRRISRRERAIFIAGTATVGLVLSLVAMVGNFQVVAFKLQGSSDDPRVLFIVSVAVTVIGSPLIYSLFKWPSSKESTSQPQGNG